MNNNNNNKNGSLNNSINNNEFNNNLYLKQNRERENTTNNINKSILLNKDYLETKQKYDGDGGGCNLCNIL